MVRGQASRKNQSMTAGGLLLLLGRDSMDSENLLIVIVEAGQKLEGPPGRRLHRIRILIVGRWHAADADAFDAATTTGTPVTDAGGVTTGVINIIAITAGDGDHATVADLLPLYHLRFLSL